ncbi:MAG: FAD-binding oxidoreductase [Parvularculaceae bacterium]|nr:FAD-binding oxidoreductase [Parvularculaceae bacterium]
MNRYDVLVIGGGLIGCASACYLARRGLRVFLAEKNDLNSLASGQNAGSLHFQLEHRLIEHGDALAAQFAQVLPLNAYASRLWAGLEEDLGASLGVRMDGGLMLAATDEETELLHKKQALESKSGIDTRMLKGAALRACAPYLGEDVRAASFLATEGSANPRLVTLAYARAAAKAGAGVYAGCEVAALSRGGGVWRADLIGANAPAARICADNVLNAAGAFAGRAALLAHLHLPVMPVPLMMCVTDRAPPAIPHLVQRAGARLSMKQARDGNIIIGGGWPARFRTANGTPDFSRRPKLIHSNVARNLALAVQAAPLVAQRRLLRCWTGVVGVTPDQLPYLGAVSKSSGFYAAVGGSGFTLGPAYASLMAELIATGETSLDISAYDPARLSSVNGFMEGAA